MCHAEAQLFFVVYAPRHESPYFKGVTDTSTAIAE
jgi:hypothetical protein